MVLVLVIAALMLAAAVFGVRPAASFPEAGVQAVTPPAAVPALPAQTSGETISEIDIRALCRGCRPPWPGRSLPPWSIWKRWPWKPGKMATPAVPTTPARA